MKTSYVVCLGNTRISAPCVDYKSALNWQRDFETSGPVNHAYKIVEIQQEDSTNLMRVDLNGNVKWVY